MVDAAQTQFAKNVAEIGNNIDQLRMAAELNAETVRKQQEEIRKLQVTNTRLRMRLQTAINQLRGMADRLAERVDD